MEAEEGVERRDGRGCVGVEIEAMSTLARIRGWKVCGEDRGGEVSGI